MKRTLLYIIFAVSAVTAQAQTETYPATEELLSKKIIALDAEAFDSFNTCNLEKLKTFFTDDLEFYHDKGGMSKGIAKFLETTQKNICSNPERRILRKPVKGSFKVYPLEGYGAILSGDHDFYILENGVEKRTGTAKFTHVWLLENGYWKMARVLSYDHKPAQ